MKKPVEKLFHLRDFAIFILNNFHDQYIDEVLANYKQQEVPILKLFAHLSEVELKELVGKSLTTHLHQFAYENPIESAEISIKNWKENKIPGIFREDIKIDDLVTINHARKLGLFRFLPDYAEKTLQTSHLLKEIETFYSYSEGIAIEAYNSINQEELLQREKILTDAQRTAKVGNWKFNPITEEVFWSEELYKIYQIENSKKIVSEEISPMIQADDLVKLKLQIKNAAEKLGSYTIEYRITTAKGEAKTLFENGKVEKNSEGNIIYRGTTQDITEFKNIENDLKINEKNFRLLAENSTDVISRHALDSTILYISPSCLGITGYTQDELLGESAYKFYHPKDLSLMHDSFNKVLKMPENSVFNFRFRKKDGTYIWFESSAKTIRDDQNNPYEIIATNRDVTERKKAELKLKKNQELLSGVLNSALSGIQVLRSVRNSLGSIIDFEWILVNDSLLQLWGKTREEIIGKKMVETFPGVSQNSLLEKYIRAANGESMNFKHYYNWEGFNHWFNIVATHYGDGIILSTYDITSLVHAEEKLKSSNVALEEKVKVRTEQLTTQKNDIYSVLMQAPAIIAIVRGRDMVFELANSLYLKVIGKTNTIIWKPLLEAMPELKGQPIVSILQDVFNTGQRFIGNEILIKLDVNNNGILEDLYFNFVYEPLKDEGGKVDGILAHAIEVTKQVEARLLVEESEYKLRTLANSIPNLAWMAYADGSIFWYNQRWYEYTGTKPEQMQGWGWQSVHDPNELPRVLNDWTTAIKHGVPVEMIFPLKGADNVYRQFLTRVVPVNDSEGKIVRWFGTNTDITEQIRIEETLEKKNNELLKINNDLDNFIYTASHDLRSPVSNLEGLLGIIADEKEGMITPAGAEIIPLISKSMIRLKTVIKELTEIARIQKDVEVFNEEISLNDFLPEILAVCQSEYKNFNGSIESDFSLMDHLKFSRKNLRSILFNMVSNALKYSDPAKKGKLFIKTEKTSDYVTILFEDNGLGIPDDQREKVFNMFKRFHTHVEGTGVGLYIVKRIMENAGGKIEMKSEEGIGTSFILYFKN